MGLIDKDKPLQGRRVELLAKIVKGSSWRREVGLFCSHVADFEGSQPLLTLVLGSDTQHSLILDIGLVDLQTSTYRRPLPTLRSSLP
jgi:hypothetical protein